MIFFLQVQVVSGISIGRNQDTTTDTTGLASGFGSGFSLWGSGANGSGPNNNEFVAQFGGSAVPEPGSVSLLALGGLGLIVLNRKFRRA